MKTPASLYNFLNQYENFPIHWEICIQRNEWVFELGTLIETNSPYSVVNPTEKECLNLLLQYLDDLLDQTEIEALSQVYRKSETNKIKLTYTPEQLTKAKETIQAQLAAITHLEADRDIEYAHPVVGNLIKLLILNPGLDIDWSINLTPDDWYFLTPDDQTHDKDKRRYNPTESQCLYSLRQNIKDSADTRQVHEFATELNKHLEARSSIPNKVKTIARALWLTRHRLDQIEANLPFEVPEKIPFEQRTNTPETH